MSRYGSTDGSSDAIELLVKVGVVAVICGVILLAGAYLQSRRESACQQRGGVLLQGTDGEACVRRDAIIQEPSHDSR